VGSTLLHDFQDGVFFVNLAPLIDPALVPSTIAEVLAVKEEAGKGLVESLADVLRDKHVLLILDNYEHVLDASSVVSSLLDRCRELHVLVTSRIPLHLAREHEYAVPPLAVPDPRHLPDVETLSQFEAVALFIERATAVMADFQVTNQNAPAVAEICSRLDGLPLAIELAAARIKLFPPQALLRRLSSRLKVLTGGPRDRPSRQQTLRNAIDWSYSLLSDDDQILFARLSVFAGGCDFEAVEAICDSTGELDVLDGISSLVDKSLLRPGGTESARMAMLQTIREYAREKLQERGEQEEIQAAHAGYFLALAEAAEEELVGGEQGTWLARLDEDLDDLRVALRWFLDHGESEGGLRLAAALYEYWRCRGSWNEGRRWLQEGLTQDDHAAPSVRAKALWVLGLFANLQGETNQARLWLEEAFGLYQELGDRRGRARVMETLGMVALWQGQYERAAALYEEGLHLSQELDDQTGMAWNLFGLGTVAWNRGELAGATRHYEETLALSRTAGNIYTEALTLTLQGQIALHQRDLAEAERLCGESLALAREAAVERIVAFALWLRSRIAEKRGHLDDAEGWARESLLLAREQRERFLILFHLGHMAKLAIARGDPHRAARLYGAEMGQRERLGIPLPHTHQADEEEMLAQTKALLDIDTFTRIGAQGQAMNLEEAIAYALEERM
jgi:predicted ATPase